MALTFFFTLSIISAAVGYTYYITHAHSVLYDPTESGKGIRWMRADDFEYPPSGTRRII